MTACGGDAKTVAMMVWNTCENDSRVIKEATTLAAGGYEVTVVCLTAPHLPDFERRDGVTYRRVSERLGSVRTALRSVIIRLRGSGASRSTVAGPSRVPISARLLAGMYRVATFYLAYPTMRKAVREVSPAVIHAHDLQTLPAAAKLAHRLGATLVYDSHELASDLSMRPPGPLRWLIARTERSFIRRAERVITVSPGIADHMAKAYGVPMPDILYNSPPTSADKVISRTVRGDLGLDDETPLALYVGGLAAYRGLEESVDTLGLLPDFHLACVGPRRPEWETTMLARAREGGYEHRLHFLDPVPLEQLTYYLSDADVGVIAIQDACLSYRYTMPNKLFETVLAGVPVVVAELPHLGQFARDHGVGVAVDQTDPAALARGMRHVTASDSFRPAGETLAALRREFAWEAQGQRLLTIYEGLKDQGSC